MTIERIEQNRDIGIFEVNIAVNSPLQHGDLELLDEKIDEFLDAIEELLGGMFD